MRRVIATLSFPAKFFDVTHSPLSANPVHPVPGVRVTGNTDPLKSESAIEQALFGASAGHEERYLRRTCDAK